MRRWHWHCAINVVPESDRKRPVAPYRGLRPVGCQGSIATNELRETAFTFAEYSVASRTLIGIYVGAARDIALAGRQAQSIIAAGIDVPTCDLLRRRWRAIAEWLLLCSRPTNHRHGQEGDGHKKGARFSSSEHQRRSRPASLATSESNCCDRRGW